MSFENFYLIGNILMLLIIFNTYVSNLVDAAELLFKAFILYLKNTQNLISFLIQVKYKTFQ